MTPAPTRSPLHDHHERLGARFVDFAGWSMPVQYQGTLAEHAAVRDGVGIFDVSHLGRFRLRGEGSTNLVSQLLCNDISKIEPGRCQYTMLLTPGGGVVDDIIVWWLGDEDFWVLPNGANYDRVVATFETSAPAGVAIERGRETTAFLAVQGPQATDLLESTLGWRPGRFRVADLQWRGHTLLAAGTGYTGEKGGEIMVSADAAGELFDALTGAGAEPVGLGARDTLRLEMGYPLWGQDLDLSTTPLEAGLGWVVGWDHDFVGRDVLEDQRDHGLRKRLVGFRFPDRTIGRHGYPMRAGDSAGRVTSGNFSPTLEVGIGLGYLTPDPGEIDSIEVEVRGAWATATHQDPPFI